MKLVAVATFDEKMGSFMRPFFVPRTPMAVRSFVDEVKRPESELGKHPEDYSLYEVGAFDEDTAIFESMQPPRLLARGSDFKVEVEQRFDASRVVGVRSNGGSHVPE